MIEISPKRNSLTARWQPLSYSPVASGPPALRSGPVTLGSTVLGQLRASPLDSRLVTMLLGAGAAVAGGMLAYEMRGRRPPTVWPTIGIVVAVIGGLKFFHDMANLR